MAVIFHVTLLLASLAPFTSAAATMQERRSLVRRDDQHALDLGASGNFVEEHARTCPDTPCEVTEDCTAGECVAKATDAAACDPVCTDAEECQDGMCVSKTAVKEEERAEKELGIGTKQKCAAFNDDIHECRNAFAYGVEDSCNCTDTYELICAKSVCEEAAEQAGLHIIHNNNFTKRDEFEIAAKFFDDYPKGCFRAECGSLPGSIAGSKEHCLFFNPDGEGPEHPKGFPVCSRKAYLAAPALTCSPDDTACTVPAKNGCPEGYDLIESDEHCKAAAACMGGLTEDPTITHILNGGTPLSTERMMAPVGCFTRPGPPGGTGDEVFFNKAVDGDEPTHPAGTPLCKAESDWSAAPEPVATPAVDKAAADKVPADKAAADKVAADKAAADR